MPSNPKAKHVTPRELRVLKRNVNQPRHDCAQVERDCMDLHAALWKAIRDLMALRGTTAGVEDLLEVLSRTSKPNTAPPVSTYTHSADRTQAASAVRNQDASL